jgi:hypothetical protein
MRSFENVLDMGSLSLKDAISVVFDNDTLRRVHGEDMQITEWKEGRRRLHMAFDTSGIPEQVRRAFCGGPRTRVTVKQVIERSTEEEHRVRNKVRMHVLGQELIKVRPLFVLTKKDSKIELAASVQVHAILPPPLNHIAEAFMIEQSERDVRAYLEVIEAKRRAQKRLLPWNPFE